MLAERGIDVSYETVRRWILKFGPAIAANVRFRRVQPSGTWHLDEVFARIGGKRAYLRRALDDEGEIFEVLTQSRRNKRAALKLKRKLLKKQVYILDEIVTDKPGSYPAALRELGLAHLHVTGGRLNYRAEVSHSMPGSGLFSIHENAEWASSRRPDRYNGFCPSTTPSTTNSMCNVI